MSRDILVTRSRMLILLKSSDGGYRSPLRELIVEFFSTVDQLADLIILACFVGCRGERTFYSLLLGIPPPSR